MSGGAIARTVGAMRDALAPHRHQTIGLVPTMGALHRGHVSLLTAARRECEVVVASLFVNPTQFGDPADLSAYPRDEARDVQIASDAGADLVFAPDVEEMYPPGFASWVDVAGPALGLEGAFRPGHFRGVATVCLKLFLIVRPQLAFFGQKDAQQVAVVKRMVRDLDLDVRIRVVPTVRDEDGPLGEPLERPAHGAEPSAGSVARDEEHPGAVAADSEPPAEVVAELGHLVELLDGRGARAGIGTDRARLREGAPQSSTAGRGASRPALQVEYRPRPPPPSPGTRPPVSER